MRAFEKIREKYKDGWWEGHDGYSPEEMFNDIEFLIGFGEESLNRETSMNEQILRLQAELIESYEMQLRGMVYGRQLEWVKNRIQELVKS